MKDKHKSGPKRGERMGKNYKKRGKSMPGKKTKTKKMTY